MTSGTCDPRSGEGEQRKFDFPAEIRTPVVDGFPNWWKATMLSNYTSLIWDGFRRSLELTELEPLHRKYTTKYCTEAFEVAQNLLERNRTGGLSSTESSKRASKSSAPGQLRGRSMFMTLVRAFSEFIIWSSLIEIVFDIVRLLPVYTLSKLIGFADSTESLGAGYYYCALLLVNNLAIALLMHWLSFLCAAGGAQMRSALLGVLYQKSLAVSNEASRRFTTGDILNILSVDVDNVFEFVQYSTMTWGGLVRILSSLALIWIQLGPSCLAGLFVIVAFVPFTVWLSKATRRYQDNQSIEKDKRLDALNEIFSGIKIIKLFAWEIPFISKVEAVRSSEATWIRRYLYGQAAILFVWYCSPFLVTAAAFGTYVYVSKENILTPEKAFISLYLFNNMRYSLTFLPMNVTMLQKALLSLKRIRAYLDLEQIGARETSDSMSPGEDINFTDYSFSWGKATPVLSNINVSIKEGELVAVVGRVGSGKSSLLNAILGETKRLSGVLNVRRSKRIAYVPQQAWIQNETVRQNVLFTSTLTPQWYRKVLRKCCMEMDLKSLPGGDMTEIGEKGANLSGGQKQRINLARAVYQKAGIYLLDDPLSAVDAHVSSKLFADVIGPSGLLKRTTRVLVTHSVNILPYVDKIILLAEGKISYVGTLDELMSMDIPVKTFLVDPKLEPEAHLRGAGSAFLSTRTGNSTYSHLYLGGKFDLLVADENVATGGIQWSVYMNFYRHFGKITGVLVLGGFIFYRYLDAYSTVYLGDWSEDAQLILTNQSSGEINVTAVSPEILEHIRDKSLERVKVYLSLGGGQAACVIVGAFCLAMGCLTASSKLHSKMLGSLMRAPMRFFDMTPIGRMINRFGKDINVLDIELYVQIDEWIEAATTVIATIVLVATQIPIFLVAMIPLSLVFIIIQKIYIGAARQFRRLLSTTRSPVLNNFIETTNGVSTIRAYGAEDYFIQKCYIRADLNQNCYFHSMVTTRWASLRVDILSSVVTGVIGLFVVHSRDSLSGGDAGLILSYSLLVCDAASWLIRVAIEVEKCVIAAERIEEYTRVESEAPWEVDDGPDLDRAWPDRGEIKLENYSTRYRDGMENVLKDIDLTIRSGEKVGVIGRSGAGKSSLTLALFRILEASRGRILIDGIDISKIGLHDLRGRLTMIPQEPTLFRGTIRSNLDPHRVHSDEAVWSSLKRAHLKTNMFRLDFEVSEAGSNLSVGERQLICLARALVRKSKILLLDEATAAVDRETDALIQDTIRRDFTECTVIAIAHRLHTVADYDTIVVLGQGRIIEVGPPKQLLRDEKSHFYSMAKDAGLI